VGAGAGIDGFESGVGGISALSEFYAYLWGPSLALSELNFAGPAERQHRYVLRWLQRPGAATLLKKSSWVGSLGYLRKHQTTG
jgi:hypothetical protein